MLTMITPGAPLWQTAVRAAIIYLVLLVGLRLSGKRQLGQMTVFDLVVLLLLSNAVQNAMVGPDNSLPGGIVAAAVILSLNFGVSNLRLHWPGMRSLVEGSPTLLVSHGRILQANLEREGVDRETIEAALREHGFDDVSKVEMCVLEIDGSISVVAADGNAEQIRHRLKFLKRD